MHTDIANIIALLEQSFEKQAWHGPAVKEVLARVTPQQAALRLPGTHSIVELVAHMAAWRRYVVRRLEGDATFKVTDEMNFPAVDWQMAVTELEQSQRALVKALSSFPAEKLQQQVPGTESPLSFYTLIYGIIQHDAYHSGQISLLNKVHLKQTI